MAESKAAKEAEGGVRLCAGGCCGCHGCLVTREEGDAVIKGYAMPTTAARALKLAQSNLRSDPKVGREDVAAHAALMLSMLPDSSSSEPPRMIMHESTEVKQPPVLAESSLLDPSRLSGFDHHAERLVARALCMQHAASLPTHDLLLLVSRKFCSDGDCPAALQYIATQSQRRIIVWTRQVALATVFSP